MGIVINLPTLSACLTCNGIDWLYDWPNVQNASMDYAVVSYQRSSSVAHYIPQKWDGKGKIHRPQVIPRHKSDVSWYSVQTRVKFVGLPAVWMEIQPSATIRRAGSNISADHAVFCSGFYWDSRQPCIATKLRLDGPEFKTRSQDTFSSPRLGRLWSPPNLHFNDYRHSFSKKKRPKRDVHHSRPSSAEIKSEGSSTPIALYAYKAWKGTTFTYHITRCHPRRQQYDFISGNTTCINCEYSTWDITNITYLYWNR